MIVPKCMWPTEIVEGPQNYNKETGLYKVLWMWSVSGNWYGLSSHGLDLHIEGGCSFRFRTSSTHYYVKITQVLAFLSLMWRCLKGFWNRYCICCWRQDLFSLFSVKDFLIAPIAKRRESAIFNRALLFTFQLIAHKRSSCKSSICFISG